MKAVICSDCNCYFKRRYNPKTDRCKSCKALDKKQDKGETK